MANEAAAKRDVWVCMCVCVEGCDSAGNNKNENNENQCKAV